MINTDFKLGILGGGQLGKMLALAAGNWDLPIWSMDTSATFPAAPYSTKFIEGNFKNYDDVYNFGKQVDVLTIEIEHVNTDALLQLEKEGVKVHPSPAKLNIIKDKGLQKQFYVEQNLPTSEFTLYAGAEEMRAAVKNGTLQLPFVQKSRDGGYDGKGVAVIKNEQDLVEKLMPVPSMVEPLVDIEKELAVVVARNEDGEVRAFPTVEMEFNQVANLVEYLICPANINQEIEAKALEIAMKTIAAYDICGLLAVELFLTKSGEILINEVAPRPHNSGHHTIDSCYTSQFQQHLRAILNWPLGETKMKTPSVMVNLLGAEGYTGQAHYAGLNEIMALPGVNLHLYGKTLTKPYRKMGHATILGESTVEAKKIAKEVQRKLVIKTL
ncbi:MAG: 5-(carboxyamino)imidazole ribonucleotide synthase [Saprospiraceae bacterium]|jgi:5-(carboxyamino)imidazole ribonucleotide synthase